MTLVAGIDSSTQACKVVVRDAGSGRLVREGRAAHPDGTEVDPAAWDAALRQALAEAGGLDDVAAAAVGGQQHGMVCLDADGAVVRPALLWNDTRSAGAARDLVAELGGGEAGRRAWAEAVGLVPVASFTVTKLRWLAEHEPGNAARTQAVCLPHDWLTWRLAGGLGSGSAGRGLGGGSAGRGLGIDALVTDRGDASGTGYWSPSTGEYRPDLLERALGRTVAVPRVLGPAEPGPTTPGGAVLGPGTGDNAAAALGLAAEPGDVVCSIGTSGVVSIVSRTPAVDPTGTVAGFADATGRFLPLVATLNAARVLDATARLLGVDHAGLSQLALSAPPGAGGLVLVPYLEGERTPDRPTSTGAVHGLTQATADAAHLARAAVEGLLCGLADGLDALAATGTPVRRVLLVGGGARAEAVRRIAPAVLGVPVLAPPPGEYVADGAARQAAWVLAGGEDPPEWPRPGTERHEADPTPHVRQRYAEVRDLTAQRPR
ncbi:xylulose kinase [Geodermatophilus sp. TF02-6]|uniref:FGGY-family carbohydrate kinase n=1 Tax=Geodermatophilus sp. TF02-6 TaxID=2250575 RepID=UPI000DEA04FE|nr:FGGY-family carbohydrate kinase [Geodermatophilus sp. TF02-6]RBY78783.1 xylulose kinase [Geodermatophilus sp. TF02-6]